MKDNEKFDSIEDMLNNPLKNIGLKNEYSANGKDAGNKKVPPRQTIEIKPTAEQSADMGLKMDAGLIERNHPANLRILSVEKGILAADKRMDTLKKIIERQNERIELMEKELDILRQHISDK